MINYDFETKILGMEKLSERFCSTNRYDYQNIYCRCHFNTQLTNFVILPGFNFLKGWPISWIEKLPRFQRCLYATYKISGECISFRNKYFPLQFQEQLWQGNETLRNWMQFSCNLSFAWVCTVFSEMSYLLIYTPFWFANGPSRSALQHTLLFLYPVAF